MHKQNEYAIRETEEYFGPLYPYIKNEKITDIDISNGMVFITDSSNQRTRCREIRITDEFLEIFVQRVANTVSKSFNKDVPVLEAETDRLRLTIVHPSVSLGGISVSIRKTPVIQRITEANIVSSGYMSREIYELIRALVRAHMNIVFCGEPGVGKTECAKFFSQYIPKDERVITIEDNPEWHYSILNPGHDSVELRINDRMDYTKAIKTCLRLNPKWMMLSEARSTEVLRLIEGFSTGVHGMTTLHTDDVTKIPDRMVNMAGTISNEKRFLNNVYSFIDVGILIRKKMVKDSYGREKKIRYLDEMCFFLHDETGNRAELCVKNGALTENPIPEEIIRKMERDGLDVAKEIPFLRKQQPADDSCCEESSEDIRMNEILREIINLSNERRKAVEKKYFI